MIVSYGIIAQDTTQKEIEEFLEAHAEELAKAECGECHSEKASFVYLTGPDRLYFLICTSCAKKNFEPDKIDLINKYKGVIYN